MVFIFIKRQNISQPEIVAIAIKRNWIIKGENPDTERTAIYVLKDFREGRLGKIILDDYPV